MDGTVRTWALFQKYVEHIVPYIEIVPEMYGPSGLYMDSIPEIYGPYKDLTIFLQNI